METSCPCGIKDLGTIQQCAGILLLFLDVHVPTETYLFGDVAIFINVIEVKSPVELLGDRTSEQHRQADDKVLEPDRAISVYVKRVEQEVSVGGCICVKRRTKRSQGHRFNVFC